MLHMYGLYIPLAFYLIVYQTPCIPSVCYEFMIHFLYPLRDYLVYITVCIPHIWHLVYNIPCFPFSVLYYYELFILLPVIDWHTVDIQSLYILTKTQFLTYNFCPWCGGWVV